MEEELGTSGASLVTSPEIRSVAHLLRERGSASSFSQRGSEYNALHYVWQTQLLPEAKMAFKNLEEQL